MAFTNLQLDVKQIPTTRDLEPTQLDAKYAPLNAAITLLIMLITMGGSAIVAILRVDEFPQPWTALIVVALILIGAASTLLTYWGCRAKSYALREQDLVFNSGIWTKRTTVLPFARIQHVQTTSGPLERYFNLSSLKFFTAGGMQADLRIEGLDTDTANRLRQFILQRTGLSDESA